MEEGYFLKDTALIDKSHDAFHHEDYVKNLKKIIEEHDPPYNIALIGKWGVGKSSIINLLKKELKGKQEIVTHEINAWKYENESLRKAFLKNLWQTFEKDKDISYFKLFAESFRQTNVQAAIDDKLSTTSQTIKSMFQLIGVLITLFVVSSICVLTCLYLWDGLNAVFTSNTFLENAKDTFKTFKNNIWVAIIIAPLYKMLQDILISSMQSKVADIQLVKPVETADEYEELFKEAIANYKKKHPQFKKLVVIVDDLDRLSTRKVVAALDAIKAFVEINECIFIVTCDENILINALEKEKLNKSPDIDGELFLDKLFHFRVPLPPIIENDMRQFAFDIGKQEVPGLVKLCNGQFEEIIDILIHSEVSTPRQVKKLLNTFANNLLIANSREAQNRKLEQQLLTGKNGIRFLAKLSVIQSDYNEININLGNDFSYLEELLNFYQNSKAEGVEVKPSIKMLFNQKDADYKIKPHYEGLMNFLTRTQHITVENLAPFIYLAQDAIGLKAGDEKQRAIRKNLISGNEKGIIDLLNEGPNSENIVYAIIEEIKRSSRNDLPSVIKASIQLINHIKERKKELADAISYLLTTIEVTKVRFWQVEPQNMLEVYFSAENKIGIENGLVHLLDELFLRSDNWKKPQGKGMDTDDFIQEISDTLELILNVINELPISVQDKVKTFLQVELDDYKFFPFEKVYSLYQNHEELFWDYFGLPFVTQLVDDMEFVDGNVLDEEINTFVNIAPLLIERHSYDFIELIPSAISASSESRVLDILSLLNLVLDTIDVNTGTKIINAITEYSFEEQNDVGEVISILKRIPFSLKSNSELAKRLDTFILQHLPKNNNIIMQYMIDFMENVLSMEENDFGLFDNIFNNILDNILNESGYDVVLKRLSEYLTDEQRTNLFNKLNPPTLLFSYNSSFFDRVYSLYALLGNDESNNPFIQGNMRQGILYFQNNQWSQNPSWANDFIKLFSVASGKLEESDIINFINALNNYVRGNPDLVIKSFMYIGKHMPKPNVVQAIEYAIKNSSSESSKLNTLEFIKSCKQFINKDNNNLTLYISYLLDNFHLNVGNFLEELSSKFSFIPEPDVIKLLTNIVNLNVEKIQANLTTIQNATSKFFSALESDKSKGNVLTILLEKDCNKEILKTILLDALEQTSVVSLLNSVIQSAVKTDRYYKRDLLELCVPYQEQLNKAGITNLLIDVLRDNDDTYIISICDILLHKYSSFRFGHEKKLISSQLVPAFRNLNMEAKEKLLEVAKLFNMEKEFEQAIKEKILTNEEEELVFRILAFRKSRFHDMLSR
ncbi:P-loop NTPase fold protein [Neobacillus sp. GCM10023253]|uniref:KAP family P-loop NTPase fold protein n=1 Tax=Neobacillus sp. GCM10023253 TaxID=3252644 RepID=UPI00361DD7A6